MSVYRSVVKWFDNKKGYGFIEHPDGESDIFVHYTAISNEKRFKTLKTGQEVEFELSDGPKGLHALNVAVTSEDEELAFEDGQAITSTADSIPASHRSVTPSAPVPLLDNSVSDNRSVSPSI